MKIKTPEDLKPGDLWLGLTVSKMCPEDEGRKLRWFDSSPGGMDFSTIQHLIDAGNDEVQREPEEVTFKSQVVAAHEFAKLSYDVRTDLKPFIGKTVEVTVRKL